MRRAAVLLMVGVMAFTALGSRFDRDARCKELALEIVKTWFENSPIVGKQVAPDFYRLRCSDTYLELAYQDILSGEVGPWVEVSQ